MVNFPTFYDYTAFFSILFSLISAIIGFVNRKKFKELNLLFYYPLASSIQGLLYYSINFIIITADTVDYINAVTVNIFLLVEFLLIYNFYWKYFPEAQRTY